MIPFIGLTNQVYSVLSRNKRHSFHFYQECYWTTYSLAEWTSWPTQYLYKDRVVETLFSFSSVQSLSRVRLLGNLWTEACQASLSITSSQSLLKLMSIESVKPSTHLILVPFSSCLQPFPASGSFQMSQLFAAGGQSIGVSASMSVLPMNIQDWFPLGWTSWISSQSKGLSWVFSNTTVQMHQFFSA